MESFSRILPISKSRFPPDLRDALLVASPLVFEENLDASYISREPHEYIHNPTRACIAVTPRARLVVMAMGAKRIDMPLHEERWRAAVDITADKDDRVIFNVQLGVVGPGTKGSSLEIRIRTKQARRIVQIAQQACGHVSQAQEKGAIVSVPPSTQRGLTRKPVPS